MLPHLQASMPGKAAGHVGQPQPHLPGSILVRLQLLCQAHPLRPTQHVQRLLRMLLVVLQDLFRRKGGQELQILKDVNGVLKPVSDWFE